jgi:hypothetical protein
MKYTCGAAVLVPDFATRWRARGEHLSKKYSAQQQKENRSKKKSYSSTSQTNTPTHNNAKSVINVKIQHHINRAAKR